jgi:hypothetical protein
VNPRPVRILSAAVLALAMLGAPLSIAAAETPATRVAPTITIKPAVLDRGDGPAIPQVLGTTIIAGDVQIETKAREVQMLGQSDDDYVVSIWRNNGESRVQRVALDGSREAIMDRIRGDVSLSRDGLQVTETIVRAGGKSIVIVRDAYTGDRLARRTFRGYLRVLDSDAGRAVIGASSPTRTFWWNSGTDATKRISTREGYFADIPADRLATFTRNPYNGGCSVLAQLSDRGNTLWRSCRNAVLASSPNGRSLLAVNILTDGPIGKVSVHRQHGRPIITYRASGAFGSTVWENNRSVLLTTYGTKKAAIVRCQVAVCERASRLIPSSGP